MDVSSLPLLLFPALIVAAILYSSVGHGGASGYMAVMALFGLAPEVMRPAALCMNIAVTSWILWRHRSAYRDLLTFVPLLAAAIPAAFVGGAWRIDSNSYKLLVGIVLLLSALRMFWPVVYKEKHADINAIALVVTGGMLGLLAGLTGVGGGIFLSPLLVVMGWCSVKKSIFPVAAFIWFNSIAGLSGFVYRCGAIPEATLLLVVVAFIGGLLGAEISFRQKSRQLLSRLLGLVLLIAAGKMIFIGLS